MFTVSIFLGVYQQGFDHRIFGQGFGHQGSRQVISLLTDPTKYSYCCTKYVARQKKKHYDFVISASTSCLQVGILVYAVCVPARE